MKKRLIPLIICLLISGIGNAQYLRYDEIEGNAVFPWEANDKEAYYAVYHFGESEAEYDIIVFGDGEFCFAQMKQGSWGGDTEMKFVWTYTNFIDVEIEDNTFTSENYSGEFVYYDSEFDGNDGFYGLKLSYRSDPEYGIGGKSYACKEYFSGKFPEASYSWLVQEELNKMSKSDLQIMRNEIFARYGYIFREGGKMSNYFKTQEWYSPDHKNVDSFLTEIEKYNIKLIQKAEKLE